MSSIFFFGVLGWKEAATGGNMNGLTSALWSCTVDSTHIERDDDVNTSMMSLLCVDVLCEFNVKIS